MASLNPTTDFFVWPEELAVRTIPAILTPFLPQSNALYNRVLAPQNAGRHCLYAASFPPNDEGQPTQADIVPSSFTILFADRSRHSESQIWLFNPAMNAASPLTPSQEQELNRHLLGALLLLCTSCIPLAPGWPFNSICRFGCLHEALANALAAIAEPQQALVRRTDWNVYNIRTAAVQAPVVPPGFQLGLVPEEQLDTVLATSSIPRQKSTLLGLRNSALVREESGEMIAWAYIGIDGSFATLYVKDEWRGRGFAGVVARSLLGGLSSEAAENEGAAGLLVGSGVSSGFVLADVHTGNEASTRTMKRLGGVTSWKSSYMWIDTEKISQ